MSDPKPPAVDRPAYYRLSTETWELILKEYREGATAPFLSRKWRVSEHAIRKRCTQHGATKRDWGDAQAIAQATAREAELEEARRNAPEAVAARLFTGIDMEADEGDAAVLGRTAVLVSGRAMKGRLWNEAKALAGLAETYSRLAEREAKNAEAAKLTVETIDLQLLFDILVTDSEAALARFHLYPNGPGTENYELRKRFATILGEHRAASQDRHMDNMRRIDRLKTLVRELGGEVPEE